MAKKILVVDDVQEDLQTMKQILENKGYEVTAVADGAIAYDHVENDDFDLVLLDIKMPTLSGYDLLKLLRSKLNHNIKLVYITIIPKQEVDMTDADGVVQKPFSPESLLQVVNEQLGD